MACNKRKGNNIPRKQNRSEQSENNKLRKTPQNNNPKKRKDCHLHWKMRRKSRVCLGETMRIESSGDPRKFWRKGMMPFMHETYIPKKKKGFEVVERDSWLCLFCQIFWRKKPKKGPDFDINVLSAASILRLQLQSIGQWRWDCLLKSKRKKKRKRWQTGSVGPGCLLIRYHRTGSKAHYLQVQSNIRVSLNWIDL